MALTNKCGFVSSPILCRRLINRPYKNQWWLSPWRALTQIAQVPSTVNLGLWVFWQITKYWLEVPTWVSLKQIPGKLDNNIFKCNHSQHVLKFLWKSPGHIPSTPQIGIRYCVSFVSRVKCYTFLLPVPNSQCLLHPWLVGFRRYLYWISFSQLVIHIGMHYRSWNQKALDYGRARQWHRQWSTHVTLNKDPDLTPDPHLGMKNGKVWCFMSSEAVIQVSLFTSPLNLFLPKLTH